MRASKKKRIARETHHRHRGKKVSVVSYISNTGVINYQVMKRKDNTLVVEDICRWNGIFLKLIKRDSSSKKEFKSKLTRRLNRMICRRVKFD